MKLSEGNHTSIELVVPINYGRYFFHTYFLLKCNISVAGIYPRGRTKVP